MPVSAEDIRSLHRFEQKVLRAVERLMKQYRWVPEDDLRAATGLSAPELAYRLGRLSEMGMLKSSSVPYKGYQLVYSGYDTLALLSLSKNGTVKALGPMIGEGKEALVYEALGLGPLVLKFHRVGQRSFHSARKNRVYMPQEGHFPWVFASTYSAMREYEALTTLHPHVRVPVPIDRNRNVVAMSLISGLTLNRCTLEEPADAFGVIVDNMAAAYRRGVIHGDLSEFNIMAAPDGIWIIDWPQWIDPAHPNAAELLDRDVRNVVGYFNRRYLLGVTEEEVLGEVAG